MPRRGHIGPQIRVGAYSLDKYTVQSIASLRVSILGSISMWINRNPNLVEYISVADAGALRHQRN